MWLHRWYNNKNLDLQNMPSVEAQEAQFQCLEADLPMLQQTLLVSANPLEPKKLLPSSTLAVPQTQTVPACSLPWSNSGIGPIDEQHPNPRAVGYSVGWPWRAQVRLNEGQNSLTNIKYRASHRCDTENDDLCEPSILNLKGRPCEQRITGATEGPAQGGGAGAQPKVAQMWKCGLCGKTGHTRRSCPALKNL